MKLHKGARIAIVALLFCAAALLEPVRFYSVTYEVWGHLRVGEWILQNRAIPKAGIFSRNSAAEWIDLHWLYQAVLALFFKVLGLRAIPFVSMLVTTMLAIWTYLIASRRNAAFLVSLALSGIALLIMNRGTEQGMISALFFAVELWIVAQYRSNPRTRWQWLLLPLFCIWANVNPGFVFGVLFLGLLAIVDLFLMLRGTISGSVAGRTWLLLVGTGVATLCSPYMFAGWRAAWTELYSQTAIRYLAETRPMAFRDPLDYVAMLFVMGSLTILGYRRRYDPLDLVAIAGAMLVAFRFPREFWLVTLCCVFALSNSNAGHESNSKELLLKHHWREWTVIGVIVVAVLLVSVACMPGDLKVLSKKSGLNLPIQACDAIRSGSLPSPIFNSYQWGSFLMWYMPEYPVATDNRIGLYGDEQNRTYFDLTIGKASLEQTPVFATANTLLLETGSDLAQALIRVPQLSSQFHVVYQDATAIVFTRMN